MCDLLYLSESNVSLMHVFTELFHKDFSSLLRTNSQSTETVLEISAVKLTLDLDYILQHVWSGEEHTADSLIFVSPLLHEFYKAP